MSKSAQRRREKTFNAQVIDFNNSNFKIKINDQFESFNNLESGEDILVLVDDISLMFKKNKLKVKITKKKQINHVRLNFRK